MSEPLLIELLTEELPPRSLRVLGEAFATGLFSALKACDLLDPDATRKAFATPRRLAALITGVRAKAPSKSVREKVLPVAIAFDADGKATPVLLKKLAALGIAAEQIDHLERAADGKADALFLTREISGQTLADALDGILQKTLAGLPIAKMMSYQVEPGTANERTVQFARPAHGLVAIHGELLVEASILGLAATRETLGHRFMSRGPIVLSHASSYEAQLLEHFVIASFDTRREKIAALVDKARGDLSAIAPEALLNEVTALVEWPVIYRGSFEREFLEVPQECLVLTMQLNQKYFALTDAAGRMAEHFLLVSNLATDNPAAIIKGNERVLRARLADAKFFFDQDKKRRLASRREALEKVAYFRKLGSLLDRSYRIEKLAILIAGALAADVPRVARAAGLSKADLTTDMVGEFPELQGIMGRYYALSDGEDDAVANAISEHYRPRFATDELPQSTIAICVAMADKMESLVGLFAVGEVPSGERDPHGLRRQALGVLRILMDRHIGIELEQLFSFALSAFDGSLPPAELDAVKGPLADFVYERLRGLLRERGSSTTTIDAVLSLRPSRIDQVPALLRAVAAFGALPEAPSLAAANKRIGNILKKNDAVRTVLDRARLVEPAERVLGDALDAIAPTVDGQFESGDYTGMLKSLASLKAPVDQFFADVMVMTDDEALRNNRLALLFELQRLMNRIADLSMLAA